ncbi:MAG: hypothetical protein OK449_10575 [Thaumarchaeota archaeon]|nr:hypothetical protein [Nitrososphaerota archaeon]
MVAKYQLEMGAVHRAHTEAESYRSWSGLAGYFDGDGTVEFSVDSFTIHIRLAFDENWEAHLVGIANFLKRRGIVPGRVRKKESFNTWHLVISNIDGVKRMAKAMTPHAVKKRRELQGVLDYFQDKLTGDEFVQMMNSEVASGQRTGKLREKGGPNFTHSRGVQESRINGEARRRLRRLTPIPQTVIKEISKEHLIEKIGLGDLSRRYGYSVKILRRVISDMVSDG